VRIENLPEKWMTYFSTKLVSLPLISPQNNNEDGYLFADRKRKHADSLRYQKIFIEKKHRETLSSQG